jgi:hypothetical protein
MGLLRCVQCHLVFEGGEDARCPQCGGVELAPARPLERHPSRDTGKTQKLRPVPPARDDTGKD